MKNAVNYQNTWLMKTSKAYELYETWKKTGKSTDKIELDTHMLAVDRAYKKSSGIK